MFESRYERCRHKIIRFGRKNYIFMVLSMPALYLCFLCHRAWELIKASSMKLVVVGLTLLYLPIFSSISFFQSMEEVGTIGSINFGELDDSVLIVQEFVEEELPVSYWTEEVKAEAESFAGVDSEVGNSDRVNIDRIVSSEANYFDEDEAEEVLSFSAEDILENALLEYDVAKVEDLEQDYSGYEFSADDWRLILVNKMHFIPKEYEVPLGTINRSLKCDERVIPELLAMLKGAADDGVSLVITSPYRTSKHQVELFDRKVNRYMAQGMSYLESYQLAAQAVTIPGTSEHEIGLSFDITCNTYSRLNAGFGKTEAGLWLAENCYKYGFILRYPLGKEYITTIEYEPWHFRYVGLEAATLMTKEGLTLEEFWEEYL